jgi:hypothetical protein
MTPEQLGQEAKKYWDVNKKSAEVLAEAVFKSHEASIPPIVKQLPGVAAFLAELQKKSFLQGAVAVLYSLEETLQETISDEERWKETM